ncbi:hypothetical protein HZA57_06120 [Candidatus Poribacteria bacterium]|nr:hypothetical protein [Candidatus Poribacteria bacterium]
MPSRAIKFAASLLLVVGVGVAAHPLAQRARNTQRLEQVHRDWRKLNNAIIAYGVDRCGICMPPDTRIRLGWQENPPSTFESDEEFIAFLPSAEAQELRPLWPPLTAPIRYTDSIPPDPFNEGRPYGYVSWTYHFRDFTTAGLLHSPGPDEVSQVSLRDFVAFAEPILHHGQRSEVGGAAGSKIVEYLTPLLYDPTNGVSSEGDLVWVFSRNQAAYGWGIPEASWKRDDSMGTSAAVSAPSPSPPREETSLWKPPPSPTPEPLLRVPNRFFEELRAAGVPLDDTVVLSRAAIRSTAEGRLGRDFADFIADPRPLACEEFEDYLQWRKDDPEWWGLMDRLSALADSTGPDESAHSARRTALCMAMPRLGKSLALRAAAELADERPDEARRSLDSLLILRGTIAQAAAGGDPLSIRIHTELGRIEAQLHSELDRRQSGPG